MSIPFPTLDTLRPLWLILILLSANPVVAETVLIQRGDGLEATAELLKGDPDLQPLLIVHGFLQTSDFFTVRRLGEALNDAGYTVLLPTLTLGINHRRQSLACEAVHSHSMTQDVAEISRWVDWLHHRSGKPVTLIGHSAGSLMLLAYLDGRADPPVGQTLMISLVPFLQGPIAKEREVDRTRALRQRSVDPNAIASYPLAFCDTYVTTAGDYLSYLEWDGKKSLDSLNKLMRKPIVILGGRDQRLGSDWMPRLKQAGVEVIEIPGANHFFNNEYEFDLVDTITDLLQRSNN
ncbi:MAG: alpha/beta fold hydrolase [Candidatus Thiodiazotropha sp.]